MPDSKKCNICGREKGTTSAVHKGEFGVYCPECLMVSKRMAGAQKAGYDRDREREDYRKDMLQPWLPNGKINVEFARAYPDRLDNYTKEELKEV